MRISFFHPAGERENRIVDYESVVDSQYWWICRRVVLYLGSTFLLCM